MFVEVSDAKSFLGGENVRNNVRNRICAKD